MKVVINVDGMDITVHKDETVKGEKYYSVVGDSKRKVVWGSSVEIVVKNIRRMIAKGEVDFSLPGKVVVKKDKSDLGDIPF